MADPHIDLTVHLPNNTQPSVGELVLVDPAVVNNVVVINGSFLVHPYSTSMERFVQLGLRLTSDSNTLTPWGVVDVAPRDVIQLSPKRRSQVAFQWHLTHSDLEAIERHRAGARYVTFHIAVQGLAFVARDGDAGEGAYELHPIHGEGQLQLSITEWEDKVLTPLKYTLPHSWDRLMPDAGRTLAESSVAEARLAEARKALRRGEARDALGATLDAFESTLSQPYNSANWRAQLEKVPEALLPKQKRDAVADMLGGMCTYLNRVGHHRGRQPDPTNTLPAMPSDQWEAEHVVAAAHFLLPLAMKLAAEAVLPVAQPAPAQATSVTP